MESLVHAGYKTSMKQKGINVTFMLLSERAGKEKKQAGNELFLPETALCNVNAIVM